ncbi:MAG: HYR domain-containing protein [Saprospiraceae bacterium]
MICKIVTLTADDGNGNTAELLVYSNLEDVTDPAITCPGNQTVDADASCAGTVGAWNAVSAIDNCGSPTVTQSPVATTPLSGHDDVETVTLTADDGNGNTKDCSFTVTLKDVSNPTVTCPGTQTVQADIFGNYTVVDFTSLATASDNCTASPSKSQSPAPNDILTVGNHTVTIIATDDVALAGDCTFTLEVTPSCQPPTVSCPTTQTVFASPSCNQSLMDYRSLATVDDGCGTTSISQDPLQNSTVGLGNHEVTITVTDQTNNQGICNFTVSVVDNTPPTFTCPDDQNININPGTCQGTVPDLLADITDAYDNCGTATLSQNPSANSLFSGSHLGQVNVIVSADDGNGNSTPCTVTLTLFDNEPPVPACFNPTVVLDGNGQYTLLETDVFDAANSVDNCGTVNFVSMDVGSVDCNNVWNPATVTVTATDGNGNTAECTATVSVEDNSLPAPQCKTTTVQLDASGNYTLEEDDVYAGGTDNCYTVNFWKMSPASVTCADAGTTIPVLVEVFDASGNQSSCTAQVTVADAEVPVAICPASIPDVVLDASGNGTLPANIGDGSSTDNCSAMETSPTINVGCGDVGPQTVTLTVTDGSNTVFTNCRFHVVDQQAPVAVCPVSIPDVVLDASGNGTLPANIGDGSSTDNCSVTETSPAISYTCIDVGPQTVTLKADDGVYSSTTTCTFNVVDNSLPTANCTTAVIAATLDVDGQYTVDPNEINNGSSDVCGGVTLSVAPSTLTCQDEGPNTVTLTVADGSGNTATCIATVEVSPFVDLISVVATDESCTGTGDGTITVTATAGGGQLGYSIDGGVSYQFTGAFNNVVSGTYDLRLKVFGIPNICEKTATATVGPGNQSTTWYKDLDNDGYTDYITQTGCVQPTGYKALGDLVGTEEDCDDTKATWFPGQVWYPDYDGDFYGALPAVVQCSCPAGYRRAEDLIKVDTDCDNNNAAVHPGAVEICNGIDDNCDGEVDEGLSGLTYVGNVLFTMQAQLDAWMACYEVIDGHVTIQGANIDDLTPLENIVEVTGNLMIMMNGSLSTLNGLDSLSTLGGSLMVYYNFQLSDCCAIDDLLTNNGVAGVTTIFFNASNSHCNSAAAIMAACPLGQSLVGQNTGIQTSHAAAEIQEVRLFPNPANEQVNVRLSKSFAQGQLEIFDAQGRLLKQQGLTAGTRQYQVETAAFSPGLYFVKVETDGEMSVHKLVVE